MALVVFRPLELDEDSGTIREAPYTFSPELRSPFPKVRVMLHLVCLNSNILARQKIPTNRYEAC